MSRRSSDPRLLAAVLRSDLGTFVAKVFQTVSPGDAYVHGWHIDAIVFALLRIHHGPDQRLIINQPPRSLKSICATVAYVAWALGHDPTQRYACVSYSNELAATLARQFRAVVTSDWYKMLFPRMRLAKDTETESETTLGGGRFVIPVGGSFTGRGADIIIVDDPMKADEAQSDKARRATTDWFRGTLLSRLNDKATGAIILLMQRLHEDDLTGVLLEEGGWYHLCLPAVAEEDQEVAVGPGAVHLFRKGEALQPRREPSSVLEQMRRAMGSIAYSAQYLQRPVPLEGNLVRRSWIKWYDEPPVPSVGAEVIQSWDIASTTGEVNDWSVGTTWLKVQRDYYLLNVWRGRLEFPSLKHKVIELARQHRPKNILIEKAGPGLHLIQDLRYDPMPGVPIPIGIQPEGDKITRMAAQSARFEAGQVNLPRDALWLADLLHEILAFPNGRFDDQVDSVSQFLNWAEAHNSHGMVGVCGPKFFRDGRQILM